MILKCKMILDEQGNNRFFSQDAIDAICAAHMGINRYVPINNHMGFLVYDNGSYNMIRSEK